MHAITFTWITRMTMSCGFVKAKIRCHPRSTHKWRTMETITWNSRASNFLKRQGQTTWTAGETSHLNLKHWVSHCGHRKGTFREYIKFQNLEQNRFHLHRLSFRCMICRFHCLENWLLSKYRNHQTHFWSWIHKAKASWQRFWWWEFTSIRR